MTAASHLEGTGGRLFARLRNASLPSRLALVVGGLSAVSIVLTYLIQARLVDVPLTPKTLLALILVNFALALALAALMAWRLLRLWRQQRSGIAGAKLHVRLVTLFSTIAVVPIVLVAVFAAVMLNVGFKTWFAPQVQAVVSSALSVATQYEKDNETLVIGDVRSVERRIDGDGQTVIGGQIDQTRLFAVLHDITQERGLVASYVINSKGQLAGSTAPPGLPLIGLPGPAALAVAEKGGIYIDANSDLGVMWALTRLQIFAEPTYLMVVRPMDPVVLRYYQNTGKTVKQYNDLAALLSFVLFILATLYILIAFLSLLVAIWLGIWAAEELVDPISRLIFAAERVAKGDLKAQVAVDRGDDELARLGHAFNRMTSQLQAQRSDLVEASHQIDARRRFMEAVLAGVSAGVVGLDPDGRITLVNRAAARLLNAATDEMEGQHYSEAVPELAALIRRAMLEPVGRASGEVAVKRTGAAQTLSVRVDSDTGGSFVVTFDDITDLVSAQRTAAWADVARRIAHEIKNPLTPIQLSAERLKRKYAREISTDPEIFAQCTDTIIRQVGDIGRMVDEFSSFARMPAPVMHPENFQELLQQSVFLQRVGNPEIEFDVQAPREPVRIVCDGRLLSQALTNILKNAGEAIGARLAKGDDAAGLIVVKLTVRDERACLTITDNGIGLPAEHRNRLTEPYVTTRAKGTGLGLAIVRKIIEDHGGELVLSDRDDDSQGAAVRFSVPLAQRQPRVNGVEDEHEQERIADRA